MTVRSARPMTIKLDSETRQRVQRLADARQSSAHWVMREAINQYVAHEEKREAYRQDGIQAWSAYQASGLHVTGDEADAWLSKLEAGHDVEPPECASQTN